MLFALTWGYFPLALKLDKEDKAALLGEVRNKGEGFFALGCP